MMGKVSAPETPLFHNAKDNTLCPNIILISAYHCHKPSIILYDLFNSFGLLICRRFEKKIKLVGKAQR